MNSWSDGIQHKLTVSERYKPRKQCNGPSDPGRAHQTDPQLRLLQPATVTSLLIFRTHNILEFLNLFIITTVSYGIAIQSKGRIQT